MNSSEMIGHLNNYNPQISRDYSDLWVIGI